MTPLLGKVCLVLLLLTHVVYSSPTTTPNVDDSDESTPTEVPVDDDDDEDWRDDTLIYHILPRSFQDSDGDGDGDLQGIISRLDYLVDIGVDTIRLGSIYSSSNIDSGYHILNHTDISSVYGSFDDFNELVEEVHKKGLKIILDVVPNQSSNDHEWFLASATNTEPYDDYYIWSDGKVADNKVVPPNNWKSAYSDDDGSAWTWHFKKKMWYYHKFHFSEPDLNLRNEDVVEEIMDMFDFWLEKGVDGFCICGVSYLFENQDLMDEKSDQDDLDGDGDDDSFTLGLTENAALLQRIREHIDEWVKDNNEKPKLLIGEVDELDDEIISYYGNETHPGIVPLNLIFISQLNDSSNATEIKNLIDDWMERLPKGVETNWQLSNQDNSRAASRLDSDSLDGLNMLTLLLPGQAVTYYGDEIGMTDHSNITWEESIDLKGFDKDEESYKDYSKDQFRTPMQWDDSTSAGFSSNDTTFLPVNPDFLEINVKNQTHDPDSDLEAYKLLTVLRENPIFTRGDYELSAVNDDNIFILKRSLDNDTCLAIINLGSSKQTVNLTALYPDLEEDLQVMVDSSNADVDGENDKDDDDDIENDSFTLHANAAAVLCDKDDFSESSTENATTDINSTEDTESTTQSEDSEEASEPNSDESESDADPNSADKIGSVFIINLVSFIISMFIRTL